MRFGTFELEREARRLSRDGEPVHLTPKAFDLLRMLIDHAPGVVTKSAIHEAIWPRQVVSDATLAGLIKELRGALADSNPDQRLIRTVHRVGYAFDAPIEHAPERAASTGLLVMGTRSARLIAGENYVGRDPACEVWIGHSTVSRRHARIVVAGETICIEDLGSKNGTFVGERPLSASHRLEDGDRIRFGEVDADFRRAGGIVQTATWHGGAD